MAVQVVKPDGIATTYNSATNITTSTMGFGTANLAVGNHTLRICVNDTTCSPSSLVSVPFTIVAPAASAVCTKLSLSLDKATYNKGDNVNYTYWCSVPTMASTISTAMVQLVKPDGTSTTYVTGTKYYKRYSFNGFFHV